MLSEDLALLQSMDEAQFAGHFIGVTSLERFVDQLVSGNVAVAVVDCSLVPEPAGEFMLRLRDQFPVLALIAAGDSTEQSCISGLIADGTVCRFVHKPASGQRLGLFLEAGLRRHAALLREQPTPTQTTPARAAHSPRRRPFGALLTAALLGVALFFYWLYYEQPSAASDSDLAAVDTQPATVAENVTPAVTPIVRETISPLAKLLDQARQRMDDGALLEPAGNNARQYIDEAHAISPDDPQVRAAAIKLGELIIVAARRAIAAGNSDDARHWLSAATDYHINPATIDRLRRQADDLDSPTPSVPAERPAATTKPPVETTKTPAATTEPSVAPTESPDATTAPPAATAAPPAETTALPTEPAAAEPN